MEDNNFPPQFERGAKGAKFNIFNINPHLLTYHWKGLLAKK